MLRNVRLKKKNGFVTKIHVIIWNKIVQGIMWFW